MTGLLSEYIKNGLDLRRQRNYLGILQILEKALWLSVFLNIGKNFLTKAVLSVELGWLNS